MSAHTQAVKQLAQRRWAQKRSYAIGPVGHLIIFGWSLGMTAFMSGEKMGWAAGLCLVVAMVGYPWSFWRIMRPRTLLLLALLAIPALFFMGEIDRMFMGIGYSATGAQMALQMALRFVVVVTAVTNVTHSVEITQMAGLLERFGLHGLGFSLGVALNLWPGLQQSSAHTWQALRMRGGLRRQWRRGLRLLAVAITANTLRRAEEIALAAEARAFSPESFRPLPLRMTIGDRFLLPVGLALIAALIWLP